MFLGVIFYVSSMSLGYKVFSSVKFRLDLMMACKLGIFLSAVARRLFTQLRLWRGFLV